MRDIAEYIARALREGRDAVLVTVAGVEGSAPRHVGSQMVVTAEGLACGTIGGGAVESHGIAVARALVGEDECRVEDLGLNQHGKNSLGMACGGDATLLYMPVRAGDATWQSVACELVRCFDRRIPAYLTLKCPESASLCKGDVALLDEAGNCIAGDLCQSREAADIRASVAGATRQCGGNIPKVHSENGAVNDVADNASINDFARLKYGGRVGDWFVMPVPIPIRAIVFGGGHVGQATISALSRVGFACTLFDDRPEFANSSKAPDATEIILGDYENIAASLELGPCDYALIMTSGHVSDIAVLGQALRQPLAYVGMIGSRRKIATARKILLEQGISEAALDSVHMPIGLDIQAETPEEIAVSIAAECILHRAKN